jgi:hypothetical protein
MKSKGVSIIAATLAASLCDPPVCEAETTSRASTCGVRQPFALALSQMDAKTYED